MPKEDTPVSCMHAISSSLGIFIKYLKYPANVGIGGAITIDLALNVNKTLSQ